MDQAIVDYLRRHYSLRIGLPAAERLRIDIGSAYPLEEELVAEISGLDVASGLPRKATITSEEVRQALADPLEAIVDAIKNTLDHCSPDLAADLMDHGLVLCGGGALLTPNRPLHQRADGPAGPHGGRTAGHGRQGDVGLSGAFRAMAAAVAIER